MLAFETGTGKQLKKVKQTLKKVKLKLKKDHQVPLILASCKKYR